MSSQFSGPRWRVLLAVPLALLFLTIAAPVGAQTDVAFLIDGSGSISTADFELERRGLITALMNPSVLPRNGSVTVTIVQFAEDTTRTEVPLTAVENEGDVAAIIQQLENMQQILGRTNPGDAVLVANTIFNQSGRPGARQHVCLATDGITNFGVPIGNAVSTARGSAIALERFAVLAVEDPGVARADDFFAEYGPHVFGGGNVTVVRNATEFANTVGPACLGDPIRLVGLEVNQAIQDWSDSIPVIAGKTTYVRAHVETDADEEIRAVTRLRGTRNGVELPGSPLVPANPGGSVLVPEDATTVRTDLSRSFYFRLPGSWLSGNVELTVEGVGTSLDCREAADTANDCSVAVIFEAAEVPEMHYVGIEWEEDGDIFAIRDADLDELIDRQVAISPVASVDAQKEFLRWFGPVPPNLTLVNLRLRLMRFLDQCWTIFGCDRLYYGAIRSPDDLGGLALGIPGTVSSGSVPTSPTAYGRNRHAHEAAHSLGLQHAPFCGASANGPLAYDNADIGGRTVATLGPTNGGEDRLIYGFDSHRERVIDPSRIFELMSYCGRTTGTERWISRVTYAALRGSIDSRFAPLTAPLSAAGTQITGDEYLLVRGSINLATDTVEFLPFASLTSSTPPPQLPSGDYVVRLLNAVGGELERRSFEPTALDQDAAMGGGPVPTSQATFLLPLPAHPNGVRVEILHNGSAIASLDASGSMPAVTVMSPNGGEVLGDREVTVRWQAQDIDGDPLTYSVQYSADDGSTWKTLVVDWPGDSYTIERRYLAGSDSARVRVMASDGFRTRTDPSDDLFTVVNNPPDVEIVSPQGGASYSGVQLVFLEARARDREDGMLPDAALSWESNLDGPLGDGASLVLNADDLTEGQHRITLTATDSEGATTTRVVTIDVGRIATQGCTPDTDTLCLNDDRFAVEVEWADFNGSGGLGNAVPGTVDSGLFWFFDDENWEILVKVLDGCDVNDRFWFFASAPTNVEYSLRVTDTLTGSTKTYLNPAGNASPAITDTGAFATCAAPVGASQEVAHLDSPEFHSPQVFKTSYPADSLVAPQTGPCVGTNSVLCLDAERFQVEVEWEDFFGNTGVGRLAPLRSDASGVFWFFRDNNWEFLVKTVDGCSMNGHHWVFAAAATSVEYTLRVTDTTTGDVVEYVNPLGDTAAAINDTEAFANCL